MKGSFLIGWEPVVVLGWFFKPLCCQFLSPGLLPFFSPSDSYPTSGLWIQPLSNCNRRHSHGFSTNGFAGLGTDQTAQMQGLFAYSCSNLLPQCISWLTKHFEVRVLKKAMFTVVIKYIYKYLYTAYPSVQNQDLISGQPNISCHWLNTCNCNLAGFFSQCRNKIKELKLQS